MNAAPDAPLQGAGLCRAGAAKSIATATGLYCTQCAQSRRPEFEAVLQFALLVDVMESPITERRKDDDDDNGGDIAAPACLRFVPVPFGRGLAHAERLEARRSTSPSAAIALATMPFASSPAAAYMRSGLS